MLITFLLPLIASAELTFTEHVRPVFKNNCAMCHNAQTALPNFLDYSIVYDYRFSIKNVLEKRTMPHMSHISESDRELVLKWLNGGAKE
jgi:hypothetical protein